MTGIFLDLAAKPKSVLNLTAKTQKLHKYCSLALIFAWKPFCGIKRSTSRLFKIFISLLLQNMKTVIPRSLQLIILCFLFVFRWMSKNEVLLGQVKLLRIWPSGR